MEYVDGGTLEPFCAPDHLLPVDKTVEIVFKCTRALEFAHKMGITHRDIKPANILYAGETDVKISDFGAALIASGDSTQVSAIGSPAYMSPQQVKEHPLDHRTDIYSMGVVMYHLLTGRLPFQASNNFSLIYQITNVEPPPPSSLRPGDPAGARRHRAPRDGQGPGAALRGLGGVLARPRRRCSAARPSAARTPATQQFADSRQVRDAARAAVLREVLRRRALGSGAHLGLARTPRRARC